MAKQTKTKPIRTHEVMLEPFNPTGSIHHRYRQLEDRVYARFRKTVIHVLSCKRLNPADHSQVVDVIIKSNEDSYDPITKVWTFNQDTDTICLYSEAELAYFVSMNAALIESGKLIPWDSEAQAKVTIIPTGDAELQRIIELPVSEFISAINAISEPVTLQRLARLLTDDMPLSKHKSLTARLSGLINN